MICVFDHKVQYYETDMMGITHHANYIRWMEEARTYLLEQLGFPYRQIESNGIFVPVRSVSCRYKKACTFGDEISIGVSVSSFRDIMLTLGYEMRNRKGEVICEGQSEHVFINKEGRIVRLSREMPALYQTIMGIIQQLEAGKNPE